MTSNLRMLGILLPLIGLTVGILARTVLNRFLSAKIRYYDFLPPFLTVGTEFFAQSLKIQGTWAFGLLAVCAVALFYAGYLAVVEREILFGHYLRVVWRLYLLIAVVWYIFILFFVLLK